MAPCGLSGEEREHQSGLRPPRFMSNSVRTVILSWFGLFVDQNGLDVIIAPDGPEITLVRDRVPHLHRSDSCCPFVLFVRGNRNDRIPLVSPPRPEGAALASATLTCRKEPRIPIRMFVNLYSPDNPNFDVTPTIDVSCHGARVVTKTFWKLNQHLAMRSIHGNLYARARVAYCQFWKGESYAVGLEIYYPERDWTTGASKAGRKWQIGDSYRLEHQNSSADNL